MRIANSKLLKFQRPSRNSTKTSASTALPSLRPLPNFPNLHIQCQRPSASHSTPLPADTPASFQPIPSPAVQTFLFNSNPLLAPENLQMRSASNTHLWRVCKSRSTMLFSTTLLQSDHSKIPIFPPATRLSKI